jgi:glycine oxidase
MPDSRFDLAVIGAGIMGLSSALEAARSGRKVVVAAPAFTGGQASWAAAGILVTRDARVFHSPFREFYVRSIHAYPEWLHALEKASGREVPLHRTGDHLVYDLDAPGAAGQLDAKRRQWEREHARNFSESDALPDFLAPHSPLRRVKVFHFPEEAYIQNRDLLDALRGACRNLGVTFAEGAPDGRWEHAGSGTRIRAGGMDVEARQVLFAAGAWTAALLETLGIVAPLVPVKGQMMRIPNFHGKDGLVHYGEELYLVPRGDSLVVGATTEPGTWRDGFDEIGETYLSDHLRRFFPGVAARLGEDGGARLETWSGLRPRTKDRLPWMGWLDASRGWAICAGHYKCGISMAPLAGECMVKLLGGEKTPVDLAPFDPWRKKGLSIRA